MSIGGVTRHLKVGGAVLLALAILGYGYFQARNLITGPMITVTSLENGQTLSSALISIEGVAKNIAYISLNDRQIFIDEEGRFSEKLLLSYGYNILTLNARDKFGRTTTEALELVYK